MTTVRPAMYAAGHRHVDVAGVDGVGLRELVSGVRTRGGIGFCAACWWVETSLTRKSFADISEGDGGDSVDFP